MASMLKEERVVARVLQHLQSNGYVDRKAKAGGEVWRRADVIVRHRGGGRFIIVEAKGETGARSERETKTRTALGQIASWFFAHKNYHFAIAVPDIWRDHVLRKISPDLVQRLNLKVYLVPPSGPVVAVNRQDFVRLRRGSDLRSRRSGGRRLRDRRGSVVHFRARFGSADAISEKGGRKFRVLAGSRARGHVATSAPARVRRLRGALIRDGVLVHQGEHYTFSRDYTFESPSLAAGVILGGSVSGPREWKTSDGTALGKILSQRTRA